MRQEYRRSINLPLHDYEALSHLQAKIRVEMMSKGIDHVLSKTAMTKLLSMLIHTANIEGLCDSLHKSK